MKSTISKELLSEVLVEDINDIVNDKTTPKNLFQYEIKKIMLDGSEVAFREINIYELAHKCKEWAISKGFTYEIRQLFNIDDSYDWRVKLWCTLDTHNFTQDPDTPCQYFDEGSEPETIFAVCQWILDHKDK